MTEHPITDHTLVRYMERVLDFPVTAMRDHILTKNIETALNAGATSYDVGDVTYVFDENRVVTVKMRGTKFKPVPKKVNFSHGNSEKGKYGFRRGKRTRRQV